MDFAIPVSSKVLVLKSVTMWDRVKNNTELGGVIYGRPLCIISWIGTSQPESVPKNS